jgi:hypothetical protein
MIKLQNVQMTEPKSYTIRMNATSIDSITSVNLLTYSDIDDFKGVECYVEASGVELLEGMNPQTMDNCCIK